MGPRLPEHGVFDRVVAHPVLFSQLLVRPVRLPLQPTQFPYIFGFQFRATIPTPLRLPVASLTIANVVALRASLQVLRIHAAGIVAGVADDLGPVAIFNVEGDAMGKALLASDVETAVAVCVFVAGPFVAAAGSADLTAKALKVLGGKLHGEVEEKSFACSTSICDGSESRLGKGATHSRIMGMKRLLSLILYLLKHHPGAIRSFCGLILGRPRHPRSYSLHTVRDTWPTHSHLYLLLQSDIRNHHLSTTSNSSL